MAILIVPLTQELVGLYCKVGTKSYRQHYLHLWEQNDPSPYIHSSFDPALLDRELKDSNNEHFMVYRDAEPAGIFKIIIHSKIAPYTEKEACLLEKLYILKELSGKGIGTQVLDYVEKRAKELNKKVLWLDTLKNGPALNFYLNRGFAILGECHLDLPHVIEQERDMWVLFKRM